MKTLRALLPVLLLLGVTATPAEAAVYRCGSMQIVAHQDDDLLFINPYLSQVLRAGGCTTTIYTTAGDAGHGYAYWSRRERGPLAAYAEMSGKLNRWTHTVLNVAGQPVNRYILSGTHTTLYFLRLPDGHCGWSITHYECLDRLWSGQLKTIHSVDGKSSYTKSSLRYSLYAFMNVHQPGVIRTSDFSGALQTPEILASGDHSNHTVTANLSYEASKSYQRPHTIQGYEGYSADSKPANLSLKVRQLKGKDFLTYAPYDSHVCQTAAQCLSIPAYKARLSHTFLLISRQSP